LDIAYIKVLTEGSADSLTAYNKGLGLHNYLYYEPQKDSAVLRFIKNWEPEEYKTYIGHFNNESYKDTLLTLVSLLRNYSNGHLPNQDLVSGTVSYCGASFYVEFKDREGVHNYSFYTVNDTLSQFDNFFHRLVSLPWKRQVFKDTIVDGEKEIVNAVKGTGRYDSIETPYIPTPCHAGIDVSKIYGSWKTNWYESPRENQTNYYKSTISKDGGYVFEKIKDGIAKTIYTGKMSINLNDSTFTIKTQKEKYKWHIVSISDSCFEFWTNDAKKINRLNRM
jgi:hypothetical protein